MAGRPLPRGERARKLVHLLTAGFALLLRWLTWEQALLCAGLAFLFNWLLLPKLVGHRLTSSRQDAHDTGVLLYPLVVAALILVFHRPAEAGGLAYAAFGWGLLAGGDAVAGVVGMKWGSHPLPWNQSKTWEGLAGYLVGGGLLAPALALWTGAPPLTGHSCLFIAIAASLAVVTAALLETVAHGLDDNLLPPLAGALVLVALLTSAPRPASWDLVEVSTIVLAAGVNSLIAGVALLSRLLTRSGVAAAWVLGVVTWSLGSWRAYLLLWLLLGLGTLATRVRRSDKQRAGLTDEPGGQRGLHHVVANGATCALGCLLLGLTGATLPAALIISGGLAAALADTMASEIGKAYGGRAYLLPRLHPAAPGTAGAFSIPGTMAGLVGATVVAVAAVVTGFVPSSPVGLDAPQPLWAVLAIALAGFVAMIAEGLMPGHAPEMKHGNNLANTVIGALLACSLWLVV
jgi:uncharacterized protein (TIGR00297 family)